MGDAGTLRLFVLPTMHYWMHFRFWLSYLVCLVPSLFLCTAPAGIFIDTRTGTAKGLGILGSSFLLALLLAWRLARESTRWHLSRTRPTGGRVD